MASVVVSKANQALVVPRSPAIMNFWPDARKLDDVRVVLPHTMHTYTMLKHLGFDVPNPMLTYYSWPGGPPFEVQRKTCKLLVDSPRAYITNSLGTGKTAAALWGFDYLYGNKLCGKLLVVTTLRNLHATWAFQVFARLPHRKAVVLHGDRDYRVEKLNEDADIYIINHDGVGTIVDHLNARTDIDVLCLDELAVYRNNSDRSKLMRKFAKRFRYVWGLTGKPMPNAPTDVWGQCRIITPDSVPTYFKACREMLMTPVTQHKWRPKPDAVERAFGMMQPNVRFTLDDIQELPPIIYHDPINVSMSAEQRDCYQRLSVHLKAMVANQQITALNAGAAMNKLLQVAGGWVYTTAPEYVGLNPENRVATTLEIIEEAEQKVIVFVPYRHALEELSQIFTKEKIHHYTVHGGTKPRDSDRYFYEFQNTTDVRVLLAHPKCCAHGLTLTAASTIIWYGPITSLDIYEQAEGRIRRVGQHYKQQIFRLQSTPIERRVYALLRDKQALQDKFLQLLEEATETV
jgi:helicase-like protein/SNF2 domain-containing protein